MVLRRPSCRGLDPKDIWPSPGTPLTGTRRREVQPRGSGRFPQLAVRRAASARAAAGDQDENRSCARDLNLDEIEAAVGGSRGA